MATAAEIKTAYAEQGALQFKGSHAGQHATVLYSDVERTRWIAVAHRHLGEGEVIHLDGQFADFRVTWARAAARRAAA